MIAQLEDPHGHQILYKNLLDPVAHRNHGTKSHGVQIQETNGLLVFFHIIFVLYKVSVLTRLNSIIGRIKKLKYASYLKLSMV